MAVDGGPAFPVPNYVARDGHTHESRPAGMSLRDYFAGQALAGNMARSLYETASVARHSYELADAMLKAREENASR
jgi:hypothetical protein